MACQHTTMCSAQSVDRSASLHNQPWMPSGALIVIGMVCCPRVQLQHGIRAACITHTRVMTAHPPLGQACAMAVALTDAVAPQCIRDFVLCFIQPCQVEGGCRVLCGHHQLLSCSPVARCAVDAQHGKLVTYTTGLHTQPVNAVAAPRRCPYSQAATPCTCPSVHVCDGLVGLRVQCTPSWLCQAPPAFR